MTFQPPQPDRPRSSDTDHAAPLPRPGFLNRTTSAPVGSLYTLAGSKMTTDMGKTTGQTVHEEEVSSPAAGNNGILSGPAADEMAPQLSFPHVTIAVVGQDHVGKTTFIQSALDMRFPMSSRSTTKKMSLDGTVYLVRLLEIGTKEIHIGSQGEIVWPRLDQESPPTIDGVLVLHDVTQPAGLSRITDLLDTLAASPLPFVLVASKCDIQTPDGPVESALGHYEIQRTSPVSPRSQKVCIAMVLRSVVGHKYGDPVIANETPTLPSSSHSRASSETPTALFTGGAAGGPITTTSSSTFHAGVDGYGDDRLPTDSSNTPTLASHAQGSRYARSNSHPVRPLTPPSGGRLNPCLPSVTGDLSPINSDVFNSFLDMDDGVDGSRSAPSSPGIKDKASSEGSSLDAGSTFDELVDRLVAQPMSKQDSKFASIFLCLYRKFAAPATLLHALIQRFEWNEKNLDDQLTRIADQLRLLNVMSQWVSEYPGDLAYPKTRKRIVDFVATLEKSHFYMFAAKEVGSYLEVTADDDDVGWSFADGDAAGSDGPETFLHHSGPNSPSVFLGGANIIEEGHEEEEDPIYHMSALDLSEGTADPSLRLSGTLSTHSATDRPGTIANQSFTFLNIEAAQREAEHLELTPRNILTKLHWRQIMDIPDEDFARELTRVDWVMYNSFRPRDLVRHVSISGPDKDKIQSLKHVNRMIKQFNHVALFVASVILYRDKPKHRAKAMEKFMNIAQKLRRLNNYNSLGAVIAGINGTPVHRLTQTRELVPVQIQKDFMRLVILMGTQKSHFAYRLAWDNSFSERIPFLPLHRRDLVSAEEGNKTFVKEDKSRINWRKFEVMGEVVLGIQRSQKTPYSHMARYQEVARLIFDIKLSGVEEDLYARSMQLEPSAGGDAGRKKFGWLRS